MTKLIVHNFKAVRPRVVISEDHEDEGLRQYGILDIYSMEQHPSLPHSCFTTFGMAIIPSATVINTMDPKTDERFSF